MLSGISVVCFASSYAVALALEVVRLLYRSVIRGALMLSFAGAGLFAHSVYLFYRVQEWRQTDPRVGSPISSPHDWCLVAAWLLVVVYLYLTCFHPKYAIGLFLWPLVLGLVGAAQMAQRAPFPRESASRIWALIHAGSILLGTVAVLVGFAAGLMYLGQAWRLKHKRAQTSFRLPSLEWLQRVNSRAVIVAALTLGLGILSGTLLNLTRNPAAGKLLPWNDPLVLSTSVMFLWLAMSGGVGLAYRPAREGRKVAYWTLVGFVFLVIALLILLLNDTQHGGVAARSARLGPPAARGGRP
jgi:ABC-type uncharacterized transport system permease subunit